MTGELISFEFGTDFSPHFSPFDGKVMQSYTKLCKKMSEGTLSKDYSKIVKSAENNVISGVSGDCENYD